MHKVKNKLEVNCVTTTPECDESCISQDLSEDDDILKKVSYKELEKMLYSTLKYNSKINEFCESLLRE